MTAATIRAGSPAKIGVSGQADFVGTFIGPIVPGHLTVSGKSLVLGRALRITQIGHLTIHGRANGNWGSSAWQYITITTLTSIGVVYTLFDSIDPGAGLVPTVNDVWRLPVVSTDGGAVTASGDGRFEIGQPTSGIDTLVAVMYFNRLANAWFGPTDITVLNPPLRLAMQAGHLQVAGKVLPNNITRAMTKGRLSIFGHQVQLNRQYPAMARGHLTLAGKTANMSRQMVIVPGHLTVAGKVLDRIARLTLLLSPGHLTVAGAALTVTRSLVMPTGHLILSGKVITIHIGLPLFMDPGHLRMSGAQVRFTRSLVLQPGHLTVRGRSIIQHTTGAIGIVDKPAIVRRKKRRNVIPSELR